MDIRLEAIQQQFVEPSGRVVPVLDLSQDLVLESGIQMCLMGASGAGKTTLLNIIGGLLAPSRGRVMYGHTNLGTLSVGRRDRFRAKHIGFVHQGFHLLDSLSALENVALVGSLAGLRRAASRRRARELLGYLGLTHRLRAKPSRLSMGERQRVAIARAVVNRPAVVLADEPTASLDADRGAQVVTLLKQISRDAQSSLLVVTHQPSVQHMFERVVRLEALQRQPE